MIKRGKIERDSSWEDERWIKVGRGEVAVGR
jgi:hypothetical protein